MRSSILPLLPVDPTIANLADRFDRDPKAVLEVLQSLQEEQGGLTELNIQDVAHALGIPPERAFGVATFFTLLETPPDPRPILRICDGLACWLDGSGALLGEAGKALGAEWRIERTSCLGQCDRSPAGLVGLEACGPLSTDRLPDLAVGWRGPTRDYTVPLPGETRVLLSRAGRVDPTSIDSALAQGAYAGLQDALRMPPAEVIEVVEEAGLRGRGGAGFPAGRKWRYVALEPASPKYIVCNADESEPLVFKDRVLIESDPHQLLEGMLIAGYAVGAKTGFIYIRGEYEQQAQLLELAILQAEQRGLLGRDITGTGFDFDIHIHRGAGAYICGEETALLESLEGRRGEPRIRPPYPTTSGYLGKPTVVNNVETLAAVPHILANGAAWYRSLGNAELPGAKIYTLLGAVRQPGLFEAGYGLSLNEIITEFGGGLPDGVRAGFALTGGAAGTIVPPALFDEPITFDSQARGVSLGAGAIMIVEEGISPVVLLRELMHFFEVESCGKCTPCRIGTHQARVLLDRLVNGSGTQADLETLEQLGQDLEHLSLCGLGQFAALPLRSALQHFRTSFENAVSI